MREPTRVLIVDDNEDQADTLAVLLDLAGYDTRTEYNGKAALDTAREFRPAACVLDIHMPGLDGCHLARALREEFGNSVRLVAVTGVTGGDFDDRIRESGFHARFAKPASLHDLITVMAGAANPN